MNELQFLADWAIRSSVLILCGAALLWIARTKDAAIRLSACTAMLAGSLLVPLISASLPVVPVRVIQAVPAVETLPVVPIPDPGGHALGQAIGQAIGHATSVASIRNIPQSPSIDWTRVALSLYACITLTMLLRLAVGLIGSLRILRRSRAIPGREMRESESVAAPVTLGVLHPEIVLPMDWREWDAAKLDAVLTHERSHIERRDPLVQMISALHRATLWFSPLAWLLHSRIVRLAEEASDDAAVRNTSNRILYAELLLEFMQRPALKRNLAAVPMARYGSPHNRIDRILDATTLAHGATRWSVAAILMLAMPLTYLAASVRTQVVLPKAITIAIIPPAPPASMPLLAQAQTPTRPTPQAAPTPKPKFEVASVKPCNNDSPGAGGGRGVKPVAGSIVHRRLNCVTVMTLIRNAYVRFADGKDSSPLLSVLTKIEGGPSWLTSDQYTIEYEADGSLPPSMTDGPMMQSLLEDRFQLKVHRETREGPVYDLVSTKGGSKIQSAKGTPCTATDRAGIPLPPGLAPERAADLTAAMAEDTRPCKLIFNTKRGPNMVLRVRGLSMAELIPSFTVDTDRIVIDKTGIQGNVDLDLIFSPDDTTPGAQQVSSPDAAPVADDPAGPDFITALQDQLGLKLEAAKGDREYLVIDSISRPTPN